MKRNRKILYGYIEGYYGRLLSWEDRHRIVMGLNKNKMNYYFYAPKEDEKHRLNWRRNYKNEWTKKFKIFADIAKKNFAEVHFKRPYKLSKDDSKEWDVWIHALNYLKIEEKNILSLLKIQTS